jgi:hypothetical protein
MKFRLGSAELEHPQIATAIRRPMIGIIYAASQVLARSNAAALVVGH